MPSLNMLGFLKKNIYIYICIYLYFETLCGAALVKQSIFHLNFVDKCRQNQKVEVQFRSTYFQECSRYCIVHFLELVKGALYDRRITEKKHGSGKNIGIKIHLCGNDISGFNFWGMFKYRSRALSSKHTARHFTAVNRFLNTVENRAKLKNSGEHDILHTSDGSGRTRIISAVFTGRSSDLYIVFYPHMFLH